MNKNNHAKTLFLRLARAADNLRKIDELKQQKKQLMIEQIYGQTIIAEQILDKMSETKKLPLNKLLVYNKRIGMIKNKLEEINNKKEKITIYT